MLDLVLSIANVITSALVLIVVIKQSKELEELRNDRKEK